MKTITNKINLFRNTPIGLSKSIFFFLCGLAFVTKSLYGQNTKQLTSAQKPQITQTVNIPFNKIRTVLLTAPSELLSGKGGSGRVINLTIANRAYKLEVWNSPIMSPEFQAAYPSIHTYSFRGVDQSEIRGRITMNDKYLNIYLLSPDRNMIVAPIDINRPDRYEIKNEDKELTQNAGEHKFCNFEEEKSTRDILQERKAHEEILENRSANPSLRNGDILRVYNFALVCTAEFTQANGGTAAAAAMVATATVNNVQAIYDGDLAIRFNLLTPVFYLDPETDPFVPNNATPSLGGCGRTVQAANAVAIHFAPAQYDIGHVFHKHSSGDGWGGGGVAGLGVVCRESQISGSCPQPGSGNFDPNIGYNKSRGWSGSFNNTSNGWYGLVAHEIGHMFGAPHTFNGEGSNCDNNISSRNSYEIGSGTTIMSYRGICQTDNNISSPLPENNYFHANSLERMINYINGNGNCVGIPSGNTPPTADANPCEENFTIPPGTPFYLTGTADDLDRDSLTYNWEQYDEDGEGTPTQGFIGAIAGASPIAPLFRNYPPTTSPTRYFPTLGDVVNGVSGDFEVLPTVSRTLNFRLNVRDNNPLGGGLDCSELLINVDASQGAFEVIAPNGNETLIAGISTLVRWTNNTTAFCDMVDIELSTDGGFNYFTLATGETNDGFTNIIIPANIINTTTARMRIVCGDNSCVRFYDISDLNFNIISDCLAPEAEISPATTLSLPEADPMLANLGLSINIGSPVTAFNGDLTSTDTPGNLVFESCPDVGCVGPSNATVFDAYTFSPDQTGTYTFTMDIFGSVLNLYSSPFTGTNCNNHIASSAIRTVCTGGISRLVSVSAILTAGQVYTLVYSGFSNTLPTLPQSYNISFDTPPGAIIFDGVILPADYDYTYIAVNTASDIIEAVSATSDFSSLLDGDYKLYGLTYYTGTATPPTPFSLDNLIGTTLSDLLVSSACQSISTNSKLLRVVGPCILNASCPLTTVNLSCISELPDATDAEAAFMAAGGSITESCSPTPALNYSVADADDNAAGCVGTPRTVTRIFTITDPAVGQAFTCLIDYIFIDNNDPVLDTEAIDIIVGCDSASNILNTWLTNHGGATANDDCSDVTFSNNFTSLSDDCGTTGSAIITFTATDDCGRTAATTATFTVVDNNDPVFDMPATDMTAPCDSASNMLSIWLANNGGAITSDDCSDVTFSNNFTSLSDDCGATGSAIVTFTATDDCGRTAATTATFTVVDNNDPVFDMPAMDMTAPCDSASNMLSIWLANNGGAIASDDCSDLTFSNNFTSLSDDCGATGSAIVTFTATDDCGRTAATTATFTIIDNNDPVFDIPAMDLTAPCDSASNMLSIWLANNGGAIASDDCSDVTFSNNFTSLSDDCGATGSAIVTFTATDECGRTAATTATFTVVDSNGPIINGSVSIGLANCSDGNLQQGYTDWATNQLDSISATDECSSEEVSLVYEPSMANVNCLNGLATTEVHFITTDNCGNSSMLTTFYRIIDDGIGEPFTAIVSGNIYTEENEMVWLANVAIEGFLDEQMITGTDGYYQFELPATRNYSVVPSRNDNPSNGVSTYDLVLLGRHLLELQPLDSPYKMIAADVDESGSITILDVLQVRRLILGIDDEFSSGKSWTFVDAAYIFPNPTNPFATTYPTVHNLVNLSNNEIIDFIGVKLADLNTSANTKSLQVGDTRSSDGTLKIKLEDQLLQRGQEYDLAFKASDFKDVEGFQFTLDFATDMLEVVDYKTSELRSMSTDNFGFTKANQGKITVSWNETKAVTMADDATLFQIRFTALETVQLSEVLRINSSVTANEAYQADLRKDVMLDFGTATNDNKTFVLLQNQPNPFSQQTMIGFQLPEATDATLTIFDVSGRAVWTQNESYEAGTHQVMIDKSDLGAAGVFYYQLSTGKHTASRKMIVLN